MKQVCLFFPPSPVHKKTGPGIIFSPHSSNKSTVAARVRVRVCMHEYIYTWPAAAAAAYIVVANYL